MKSILYVGATLMIGASIYGFVDYQKSNRKNEFKHMYDAVEPATDRLVVVAEKKAPVVTAAPKPVVVHKQKTMLKEEKTIAMRSKVEIAAVEKIESTIPVISSISVKTATPSLEKFKHTSKKLSYKLFSRAAPPRPVREETITITEPVKVEKEKTEIKEQ